MLQYVVLLQRVQMVHITKSTKAQRKRKEMLKKICASGCNSGKSIFAVRQEAQHFSQVSSVQLLNNAQR
jgi:hypothetical protein